MKTRKPNKADYLLLSVLALTALLAGLKVAHQIALAWAWVFIPIYVYVLFFAFVVFLVIRQKTSELRMLKKLLKELKKEERRSLNRKADKAQKAKMNEQPKSNL